MNADDILNTLDRSQETIKVAQEQQTLFITTAIIGLVLFGLLYIYQMKKIERLEKEARDDRATAMKDLKAVENQSSAERTEYLVTLKQMQNINEDQNETLKVLKDGLKSNTEAIDHLGHRIDLILVKNE